MARERRPPVSRHGTMTDWQIYRRLLAYVLPYWWAFLLSVLGYLVYAAGNVLLADMMQFLLDALGDAPTPGDGLVSRAAYALFYTPGTDRLEFTRVVFPLSLVLLACLRALGFFAGSYCMNRVARDLIHALRCQVFDRMLDAPSAYYDSHSQGVLISRLTFNVEQVSGAVTRALRNLVQDGLTVAGLVAYMLYLNWRLCLVFLAVAPLLGLVVAVVGRHFRRYSRRIQASMGDVTQVAGESIGNYREVRSFGGRAQQSAAFSRASDYNRVQSLKLALLDGLSTPVVQTLLAVALGVIVWLALKPAWLAGFSAGSLVAFLTAAGQLSKPIRSLTGVQSDIQRGLAAAEDIFTQLDLEPEPDRGQYATPRAAGRIELRGVRFAYPGSRAEVLRGIDLDIAAGENLALVGRSGSGKSTLVQLLMRFYAPTAGSILLDGVDIAGYRLANLRDQIAMVSQHTTLFHDTVYNNIAYGRLAGRDPAAVSAAAEAAFAKDFIAALPQGIETRLGDDGGGLSGGQRQRIAIARALLKDAPVIVFDEATASLDNESEYRIRQSMEAVSRGRTTIVIAHRLTTVERADRIVVMDAGRIVQCGSHAALLAAGGLYAQLYHQEFEPQ